MYWIKAALTELEAAFSEMVYIPVSNKRSEGAIVK